MFASARHEMERTRELLAGYGETEAQPAASSNATVHPGALAERWRREAGLSVEAFRKQIVYAAVLTGVGILAGTFAFGTIGGLLLGSGIVVFQWRSLRRRAFRRAESFERDYTAFLLSLASAIRTGLDPLIALIDAHRMFPEHSEMGRELRITKDLIDQGSREEVVLQRFAESIPHPDIQLFRTAMILARREGSSLAECLQRLARVTRQRQSFRRKIRGATAMQRLSSYGILVCAVAIGLMQFLSNPRGMMQALDHPLGFKALVLGGILLGSGVVLMMHLTRSRM